MSIFSGVLVLAAFVFIGDKVWSVRYQLLDKMSVGQLVEIVIIAGGGYAVNNFLLVLAWRNLLGWLGKETVNWNVSLNIYGITQIAKYLPGNVIQFPGRHVLGRQAGMKHEVLLGAAALEVIGLLFIASVFSLFILLGGDGDSQFLPPVVVLSLMIGLGGGVPLLFHLLFSHIPVLQKMNLVGVTLGDTYRGLLGTWLIYLAFFALAGGILFRVIYSVNGGWTSVPFLVALSAYAVSWLAGTVTPGAPGGVGVREAVLILMLSNFLGEPMSVLVALVSRLVTIFGDIYFYLFVKFFVPRGTPDA
jgi:hypothetical protein